MDVSCDRCDRETCFLLALLADVDRQITPEHVLYRMRQALAGEGDVPDVRN